jgi:hypothetical protein
MVLRAFYFCTALLYGMIWYKYISHILGSLAENLMVVPLLQECD